MLSWFLALALGAPAEEPGCAWMHQVHEGMLLRARNERPPTAVVGPPKAWSCTSGHTLDPKTFISSRETVTCNFPTPPDLSPLKEQIVACFSSAEAEAGETWTLYGNAAANQWARVQVLGGHTWLWLSWPEPPPVKPIPPHLLFTPTEEDVEWED